MGLPPEEYKPPTCEEYGSTPQEFRCYSTGGGGGAADIKCNTPFGAFLYLKTLVIYEAVFGSSSNAPPGFRLWGGTLH